MSNNAVTVPADKLTELQRDAARLDWLEQQQDVTYQDYEGHWTGCNGPSLRDFIDAKMKTAYETASCYAARIGRGRCEHFCGAPQCTAGVRGSDEGQQHE